MKQSNQSALKTLSARHLFFILLVFFIVSLIPLYIIGGYAHPSVDDYYYGAETAELWKNTRSVGALLTCAARETGAIYYKWQGNFSAIFLMQLQPGIFGENYYFIAPLLLITAYAACSLFFFDTAMKKIFGADKYRSGIVSLSVTFVSMQLANVPSDSFYWYNGSIYYTFFYSLMLLLFALMIRMNGSRTQHANPAFLLPCIILAFFIGGSNYATALFTSIILALTAGFFLYRAIRQKTGVCSWRACFYCLIAVSCMTGLFISIAAPGNANRQADVGGSTGLVMTFIYTFAFGGYSLANVLSAPCIIFFLCITPILYAIAKRTAFSFRCPLLVLIFTFGLYSSAGTPVFYAQGLRIPYRLMNIIYFSAYPFIGFNLLYFLGWLEKRFGDAPLLKALERAGAAVKENRRHALGALAVCLSAFFIACVGRIAVAETEYRSGSAAFKNMPISLSAVYSLATGEAKQYDAELTARDEYLSSCAEETAAVPSLTVHPELIFHTDITTDPKDWRNAHVAMFYHKEAVWLAE